MSKILNTKSIYYNDVNLIAQPTTLKSRKDIPQELYRVFVSPMAAVVGEKFVQVATELGLTVCLHRFCPIDEMVRIYNNNLYKNNIYCSIGLNDWDRVKALAKCGNENWIIDCANGYLHTQIKATIDQLSKEASLRRLIIGNIMTWKGVDLYHDIYEKYNLRSFSMRCGISSGAACATNDSTGYNRGQITELIECYEFINDSKLNIGIIADGGIKNASYAAKALGAGASKGVMMGSFFSKALEAHTNIIGDGTYWGGASTKQQELYGGVRRHSEGKVVNIDSNQIKPLKELVDDLWGGISSAVSYSGFNTLSQFIGNGVFEIKENSLPPNGR